MQFAARLQASSDSLLLAIASEPVTMVALAHLLPPLRLRTFLSTDTGLYPKVLKSMATSNASLLQYEVRNGEMDRGNPVDAWEWLGPIQGETDWKKVEKHKSWGPERLKTQSVMAAVGLTAPPPRSPSDPAAATSEVCHCESCKRARRVGWPVERIPYIRVSSLDNMRPALRSLASNLTSNCLTIRRVNHRVLLCSHGSRCKHTTSYTHTISLPVPCRGQRARGLCQS